MLLRLRFFLRIAFFVAACSSQILYPVTFGSNSNPSRQSRASLPAGATNILLGFASFDSGFLFAGSTTTCTYDNFFPVCGDVDLSGGNLYLNKDLVCTNTVQWLTAGGLIIGATHSLMLPNSPSDFSFPLTAPASPSSLLIHNLNLVLNTDTTLRIPLMVAGNCKINGRGKRLTLAGGVDIAVRPGATLVFEDTELQGFGKSNIRCMTDDGAITFCHSKLNVSYDYTFSRGTLFFDDMVMLTGTNSFIYASGLTSTIGSQSTLYVGKGTILKYAPIVPRQNLLYMTDATSVLYVDGGTLYSTSTGLRLLGGSLVLDDQVTLSSDALYSAEGMSLKSSLAITVRGGANTSVFGIVRADV